MRTRLASEVQQYLDSLSQAVEDYQPLVERRVSQLSEKPFSLGEIRVKDMKYLAEDILGFGGLLKRVFGRGLDKEVNQLIRQGNIVWNKNNIYVSSIRAHYPETNSELQIPLDVVHEISHGGVWTGLGGEDQFDRSIRDDSTFNNFCTISQAFALYCEQFLFKDIYPEKVQKKLEQDLKTEKPDVFTRRRGQIKRTVEICGEKVLLEIPKKWRQYRPWRVNKPFFSAG